MINILGNFLQIVAMILAMMTIITKNLRASRNLCFLSFSCIICSFLALVVGFIVSDFSIQNVFLNSSTAKPLIFKISAAWASHEGSMLFWLSLLCLVCMAYIKISANDLILKTQLIILSFVVILFCSFIYFTSNPFVPLTLNPTQGLGLNPVLQDVALAIHPPILYLGNVSYIVMFTNAIIILFKNDSESIRIELLKLSRAFSNFSLLTLTLGIGLGAWWAYRELGWGGYWFFDPVENISLLPWLSAIGLHHSLLMSTKHERFIKWTLVLSIVTFILIIFGFFLIRSGLLTSVHTFASSPERALFLFVIVLSITISSMIILLKNINKFGRKSSTIFKEIGFTVGNILWSLSITVLLSAVLYPIIYYYIYNQSISLSLDFFTQTFVPVIIVIILTTGIFSAKNNNNSTLIVILTTLILLIISTYKIKYGLISLCAAIGSTYLILQTVSILINKSNCFQNKITVSAASMIMGHLGFGLLAFSITFNTLLQSEMEFVGEVGASKNFNTFEVNLKNIRLAEGTNYYRQIAEFWITDKGNQAITILKPENRYYKVEKSLSQESDIYSYLTHDIYAVLSNVDGDIVHAKIYYRPLISIIWLSIIIICIGFLIGLIRHNNQYKTTGDSPKF